MRGRKTPNMIPRAADERVLNWIRRRRAGESCADIARIVGVNRGAVVRDTNKVRDADIKESGETDIEKDYW
jgi:hypothetical protein